GFAALLGIDHIDDGPAIGVLVVGIIVVEAVLSRLWLARMRFGPAEWAWRCVTWWHVLPIRGGRSRADWRTRPGRSSGGASADRNPGTATKDAPTVTRHTIIADTAILHLLYFYDGSRGAGRRRGPEGTEEDGDAPH